MSRRLRKLRCWLQGHDNTRELWRDERENAIALRCDYCRLTSLVELDSWEREPHRYWALWAGVRRGFERDRDARLRRAAEAHRDTTTGTTEAA